jgi:hypothetical protein
MEPGHSECGEQQLFKSSAPVMKYEYAALVTSLDDDILTVAQRYRDRGDAENNYDEQTNQWGWGGVTRRRT